MLAGDGLSRVTGDRCALVLLCMLVSACSAGGARTSQTGTRTQTVSMGGLGTAGALDLMTEASIVGDTIPAPLAEVWLALPSTFDTFEIEPIVVDAGSLIIGNPDFTTRRIDGRLLSTYVDCGSGLAGPNADQFVVTLQWMVQLSEAPGGDTAVAALMDAYARPRDVAGNAIHCVSRGILERRLGELIRDELSAASPAR